MSDILVALDETAAPYVLISLGALMVVLSLMQRRVQVMLGGVLLLLGVGISIAPGRAPDDLRHPAADYTPASSARPSAAGPAAGVTSATPIDAGQTSVAASTIKNPAGALNESAGCTARLVQPERTPDEMPDEAVKQAGWEDDPYAGFLGVLLPSSELLPCATRQSRSRPLTARAVAEANGRPAVAALHVLNDTSFDAIGRTYGSECSSRPSKDEVPRVHVEVLRFDTIAAAEQWGTLAWGADADAVHVSEASEWRTAWLKGSCGGHPAAAFRQEARAGNVWVTIVLQTAADNLMDPAVENYARVLLRDMIEN